MSLFMVFKKCEPKVMREGFQIVCKSHKSKKLLVAGQLCRRTKETHFFCTETCHVFTMQGVL